MDTKQIIDKLNELLVGMTIDQAKIILAQNTHRFGTLSKIRKLEIDKIQQTTTCESRNDRLNVVVINNKINEVISIG